MHGIIFLFVFERLLFTCNRKHGRSTWWTMPLSSSLCCSSVLLMLGLHSFSFSKIQRHLPPFLIVAQLLSVHASMNCLNNSHAKRFAQSADYFWLCLRLSVGSFQCDVSPKRALVTIGNVGDHYHISPVTIQSNLNVLIKRHFGNFYMENMNRAFWWNLKFRIEMNQSNRRQVSWEVRICL